MRPLVGYKTLTPVQLCNCIAAYREGSITYRALRVYLATFELLAIREAAQRSQRKKGREPRRSSFRRAELERLTGLSKGSVARELGSLTRAGLVQFGKERITVRERAHPCAGVMLAQTCSKRSPVRPLPVPRPVLRFLCSCSRPTTVLTTLAYILRGLAIERRTGRIKSRGTMKCSWVAANFGMSLRAARKARSELIASGLVSKDEGSHQLKLNRDGAYFVLNPAWLPPHQNEARRNGSAPLPAESGDESAPPRERLRTPYGSKDQKTRESEPPGACTKPDLKNVIAQDLMRLSRLEVLFKQAVSRGLVSSAEADALNVVAAAVRARQVRDGDPVRVFLAIVRRKLWHHVTAAQEDRARVLLRGYREGSSNRFRIVDPRHGVKSLPTAATASVLPREEIRRLVTESLRIAA